MGHSRGNAPDRDGGLERRRVTVGSVTVDCPKPSAEEIARNVDAGQRALERGLKAMLVPGVKLDLPSDAPRYRADPERPDRVIRAINGVEEHGTFVGGKFRKRVG